MEKLVAKALEIAASQEGVRETANNAGPKVNEFLRSTGLRPGFPWCAAFVYWCIEQAAKELKVANPFIRTAGCAVIDSWAQQQDISFNTPQPGDVFLRRGTVDGVFRACHTGFVEHVNGVTFTTWEGNTNTDGSREGIGVFHRPRTNSDRFCFVRWANLLEGEENEEPSAPTYKLFVSSDKEALCEMPIQGGRSLCPVRVWGKRLGFEVDWNEEEQMFLFDGKEIVTDVVIIDGKAHAPIRDLAKSAGLQLKVDAQNRKVEVSRVL